MILLILIAVLSVAAIVPAVIAFFTDGYRAVPTERNRLP